MIHEGGIYLPLHPGMSDIDISAVCDTVQEAVS
jgi:dTDP-4-amino-4,6-dideoxygalactose transaminase